MMLKRSFDVVFGFILLCISLPLLLLIAALIKLSSRGPVFYVQQRVGYKGQTFGMIKFRSMHSHTDDHLHRDYIKRYIEQSVEPTEGVYKIINDPRIFPLGRLLRRHSIDELPQLINVLLGDMSLIGPRPALVYEVEAYLPWHHQRFNMLPGITGLWQVSGRNKLSFEQMVKLDIHYIENWSFSLDLKILWRTIRVVLREHAY